MIRQCVPKSTKQTFNSKDEKNIKEDFNQLFVSVGKFAVNKMQSFAHEWHLSLNLKANYFVPRLQALCKQFTLNSVESNQI